MLSLASGNTGSGPKKIYIGPRCPNSFKRIYDGFLGISDSDQESADDVESNHANDDDIAVSNQSAANEQTNNESLGNFYTIEKHNQLILFSKESVTVEKSISNKELISFSGI